MERYSEYKDSGAQWLGKIPKHWDVIKAKYLWNEVFSFSENGSENLLSVSQYDGVTQAKNESRSESLKGYKKVVKNNLVINIMLAWMGGLGVSEYNGIVSPAYCVYRLKKAANPQFMHYLYKTPMYLAEFARHSTGVIPSRWRMYTDDFGQVLTLIPPIDEQDKIVSYLDKVTSKIDEAIAQQQKINENLHICQIHNLFCLHSVPDDFEFSFIDSSKLKNIRKLETEAFKKYLPDVKDIGKDCYNIMFLKDCGKESYSLFTTCSEETIGTKQISLAIATNILCSLLFFVYSVRTGIKKGEVWYIQMPWEGIIALFVLIVLCLYLFHIKRKK